MTTLRSIAVPLFTSYKVEFGKKDRPFHCDWLSAVLVGGSWLLWWVRGCVPSSMLRLDDQSLSEPTADEPFLFLFGALGLESSSSDAELEALSSSVVAAVVGGAAPLRCRGLEAGAALRRDFGGLL